MKRKLLIFTLFVAMLGTMAFATACKDRVDPGVEPAVAGDEVGEYYCDVNESEYLLTLTEKCEYTLVLGGESITGNYVPNGEELKFTIDGSEIAGTYFNDAVTLPYGSVTYKFIRKVNYTITFQTGDGTKVESLSVRNGRKAMKPDTIPTISTGEVFVGWYTDKAFKSPYDWDETVTSSFTLYARFVQPIEPEFTVTFNVDGNEGVFASVRTIGHKIFELPVPEKEGSEFAGWWVSAYNDAERPTYRYVEQELTQNTTFYAMWVGDAPIVSVEEKSISWTPIGSNNTYTIVVKNLTTGNEAYRGTTTMLSYGFDFARQAAGEYEITVQANNKPGKAYYINKALAKVSVFEVVNSTLIFNKVENAERYLLYIECGTPNHHNEPELILANQDASYDFSDCEMKNGKLVFKVRAEAEGYLASESDEYVVSHTLDKVANISVDAGTQILTWSEVPNATAYTVVIKQGDKIVRSVDVTAGASLPLKTYNKGVYDISVTPKARGWNSPEATTWQYTKATLAAPSNLRANLAEGTIEWDPVQNAIGYEVTIEDNAPVTVTEPKILFSATMAGGYDILVRALAANAAENSLASDVFTVRYGELGGELHYQDGIVTWDSIFGIDTYYFSVQYENETAETMTFSKIYEINVKEYFVKSGTYKFALHVGTPEDSIELSVRIYRLSFDVTGGNETPESLFLAVGDKIVFPNTDNLTKFGHTFSNWYTAENGGQLFNDSVYLDERDRTVYAHWDPMKLHISLDVGTYGVMTDEITAGVDVNYNGRADLPIPESNDPAMGFAGWYASATGGAQYTGADGILYTYSQATNVTLYAKWVSILEFTPIYDGQNNITGYRVSKSADITMTNMRVIHIPEKYEGVYVTEIIDFTYIASLEVMEIPDSIKFISIATTETAFTGCSKLQAIKIYETDYTGEKYYFDDNGVLIYNNPNTGRVELKLYPVAREGDTYDIPDGVQVLPANVIWNTANLVAITIPASVILIESQAIGYASNSYYGSQPRITTITFKAAEDGVTEVALDIHEEAFYNTRDLIHLTLPSRLTNFNFYTMFGDAYPDSSSRFTPNKLQSFAFVGTGGAYRSASDGSAIKSISGSAYELVFYFGDPEEFKLPQGYNITSIGESAVRDNTSLTAINIPSYVTNIGAYAFYGCKNVTTLTFDGDPDNPPLRIGDHAFYGIGSGVSSIFGGLTSIELPGNLASLGAHAFGGNSNITTVTLDSAATISEGAFSADNGTSYVTTLIIGPNVKDVNFKAIFGSNIKNIQIDENNPYYAKDDDSDIIYNGDFTEIVWIDITTIPKGTFEIRGTVKRIAANTFAGDYYTRPAFTAVVIPASVEYIGDGAFTYNTNLTAVTFASPAAGTQRASLTFGNGVFENCSGLTSFTFPEGTVSIGRELFVSCSSLTRVEFPSTLEYIQTVAQTVTSYSASPAKFGMFTEDGYSNSLATITVAAGNTNYRAINNVLYKLREETNAQGNKTYVEDELLYCAPKTNVKELVIPGTVTYIWNRAFYAYGTSYTNSITKISFSTNTLAGTLQIGTEAFYNSANLASIVLPVGTVSIGAKAFYNSGITAIEIPYTVRNIYEQAFYSCSRLESVSFAETPDGVDAVSLRLEDSDVDQESTAYGIFYGCSKLGDYDLVLPERTSYIGYRSFEGVTLGSVTIPATVTEIAKYAFIKSSIPNIIFAEHSQLRTIGAKAFQESAIVEIVIPASVTTIDNYAFYSAKSLVRFTVEDNSNLTWLGEYALASAWSYAYPSKLAYVSFGANSKLTYFDEYLFRNTASLAEIVIPASIEEIGENAFEGSGVKTITFEEGSKLHIIYKNAFMETQLESFSFPDTDREILLASKIFEGCTSLEALYIGKGVLNLNGALDGCMSLKDITVHPDNPIYEVDGPYLRSKVTGEIILTFGPVSGRVEVTAGTTEIVSLAYANQTEITEIFIPKSVMSIGSYAFQNCTNLVKVEFETGSALQTIGVGAFDGCVKLSDIDFTQTTQLRTFSVDGSEVYSPSYTFKNCSSLRTLDFSRAQFTTIPSYTFDGCTGLTTLKFPRTLETIVSQKSAYQYMDTVFGKTQIVDIDLSNTSLTSLPQYLFYKSATLQTVKLPATLTLVEAYAFSYCTALTEIDFSDTGVAEIGTTAFNGCESLTTVKLSVATRTLRTGAFVDCTALETIDLSWVQTVEMRAFYNSGLKTITLPGSVTNWGGGNYVQGVFSESARLKEVIFSSTIDADQTFGQYMFYHCTALETITFESGCKLTNLGSYMFEGCTALESITLPASITTFATSLFKDCTNLKYVDLSKLQVTSVDMSAFSGCKAFETFKFPAEMSTFSTNSFTVYSYKSLKSVTLPGKLTVLPDNAFKDCTTLEEVILPETLTSIGSDAFNGCTSLTRIDLPASVTTINAYAFQNSGLTSITLSGKVRIVGNSAFTGSALKSVTLECIDLSNSTSATRTPTNLFKNCVDLETVTITGTLTTIGESWFEGCTSLTKVTLSDTVNTVGDRAFYGCENLSDINRSQIRSEGTDAFTGCDKLNGSADNGDDDLTAGE